MSIGGLFAMQSFDHGRCPTCWAIVQKEDQGKHMDWHDKLVDTVAQAMRKAARQRGER